MIYIGSVNDIEFNKYSGSERVQKAWGEEIILHNRANYCCKLLRFNAGGKFSMHFHIEKNETWYVNKGTFLLTYIDTEKAERNNITLTQGDIIEIEKGLPHQLECPDGGEIFEASTMHYDYDSYRIEKGDSQL
jgi:mannose-6-phosphate isomerase-like protein (cupin superfamily)